MLMITITRPIVHIFIYMNIKKIILAEINDFEWADYVEPSVRSVEDLDYVIDKPFNIVKSDGTVNNDVDSMIFWVGGRKNDSEYYVCWHLNGKKNCHGYKQEKLVSYFDTNLVGRYGVTWKFI